MRVRPAERQHARPARAFGLLDLSLDKSELSLRLFDRVDVALRVRFELLEFEPAPLLQAS